MALVFISYSSKHVTLTRALARAIEDQYGPGSVWWDQALESHAEFEPQITSALRQARVVVVIWSLDATASNFVYSEANEAARAGKLVNVRPADVPFTAIPKPFDIYHVDDLANTDRILATIAAVMRGTPVSTRVPLAEIYRRHHGKRVLEEKLLPLPADLGSIGPSDLLQAKYAVVGYDDATGMRQLVLNWCLADQATAGRVVYGAGGFGKTRLMIEVAARLRGDHGWQAGFLDRPPDDESVARQRWQALDQLIADGENRGLLIVMDYAESRRKEVAALAERLGGPRTGDSRAIRLVLLTRSAGDWWTTRLNESEILRGLFRGRPGEPAALLMPSMTSREDRLAYFAASVRALEPVLRAQGYAPRTPAPSQTRLRRIEHGRRFARPLTIQMEAMLWLASSPPEDAEQDVATLLARVMGLERAHWSKLLGPLDDDMGRDLRRGVAQVTAVQGVDSAASAEQLLMSDRFYGDRAVRAAVDPVVRRLALVYGRPDGGIAPLEPDLIGEHHVAGTADIELIDGCLAWIETQPAEARARRRQDLLTVLQRATQVEHGEAMTARITELLDHVIRRHGETMATAIVAVMGETSGGLFSRLTAQVERLPEPTLAAINFALPIQHVSWMGLSLRVAERHAEFARRSIADHATGGLPPEERRARLRRLASAMLLLGIRLSNLRRYEAALVASQEAVDLYRTLSKEWPDAFLPDLGRGLHNLGANLSDLGRHEAALAATREAVDVFRALAKDRPDTFLPDVADNLNNYGNMLSSLSRGEAALITIQEAVELFRALAEGRPEDFLPDLARSVGNLGAMFANVGRREAALAAAQEAVELYRVLAKDQPDAFLPDLARALHNNSLGLCDVDRPDAALAAAREAVELYRGLAKARPDAFLPDLATGVSTHRAMLANLGRHEAALAAAQEAVDLYRALAKDQPDPFMPHLAGSLNRLGGALFLLSRSEAALVAFQEAVALYRALAKDRSDIFLADLAESLDNLGGYLSHLGRHQIGLPLSQEAVDFYRALATSRPDAFLPALARTLGAMSETFERTEQYAEAAEAAEEGLAAILGLAETQPDAFGELARALGGRYVNACQKAGREPRSPLLWRVAKAFLASEDGD